MNPLLYDEALRWLTQGGGKWRKKDLVDGAVIIVSIWGLEAYGEAKDDSETSTQAGLTDAINALRNRLGPP